MLNIMLTSCLAQGAMLSQNCGGKERARPRTGKARAMSKTASQHKPASQGGAGGLTAKERRLSQLASSKGGRASQSEARQASQASGSRVSNFTRFFSIFTTIGWRRKPLIRCWWRPQDTRTAADAFWRPSAWYLSILVDVRPQPGRNGKNGENGGENLF